MEKQDNSGASVVSPEACNRHQEDDQEQRERMWRAIDRVRERNADRDPDEVRADVTRVVENVRRERYEQELRGAEGRR